MNYINKTLNKINIIGILILLVVLLIVTTGLGSLFKMEITESWAYLGLIMFFIYALRDCREDFISKLYSIFDTFSFKSILSIVILNIFFSYGMLLIIDLFSNSVLFLGQTITLNSAKNLAIAGGIFSTVIIAPIFEEILFRGVFLQKLKSYFKLPVAIILTAVLFGVIHNVGGMISAAVFGICMCILYIKSGNILVPIFAHFLNNLIAELISTVDSSNLIFSNHILMFLFGILAIISAYLLFVSLKNEFKQLTDKNESKK
ncbi:lysostaphin resistance A-like protein [Methanobrevibacter sp. DSM 116169]|uniref:CPBP family intramembrane glutamic endopeptidase n=1 Tax=Methanobrevibacter sp. DSM 116169 TaxID=3242727 RepID=UPI0038FC3F3A